MTRALGWLCCAALLWSCAAGEPSAPAQDSGSDAVLEGPAPVTLPIHGDTLLSEALGPCDAAVPLTAWSWLCQDEAGAWLVEETGEAPRFLGEAETASGARVGDETWVLLDGQPWLWDGAALAALDIPTPVPLEALRQEGDRLWMSGVGRLFSWSEGTVSEWSVEGHDTIHGFAATGPRLHLAVPELLTLRLDAGGPVVEAAWPGPVSALAAAGPDELWFLSEGRLYRKVADGEPVEVLPPGPVSALVGPGPWLLGEGRSWRVAGGALHEAALPADAALGVDAIGRLWTTQDGVLTRHDPARGVAIVGLPDPLEVATAVTLLPTDPDSLDAISVWVGDQPLEVQPNPYTVVLDPEDLDPGEHALRFFTESALGDHLTAQALWVGELPDATWADVSPIHAEHCSDCHGGATATDLSDAAAWQAHIDPIIDLVTNQQMPLGGPYLSDEEIVLIRAWKHGGFQ